MKRTKGEIKTIRIIADLLYSKWYCVLIYNVYSYISIGSIIYVPINE